MRRIIYRFIFLLWFCFFYSTLFAQSNKKIDSLIAVLKTTKEDTNKVTILNSLSRQLWQTSDYPKAEEYAVQALSLAEKVRYKKGIANSYNNIGTIKSLQANLSEALKNHLAALKVFEEIGDKRGLASAYNGIGIDYRKIGNYTESLKNYLNSLKISEAIDDKPLIATSYQNIAVIYERQKNFDEALKNLFACLKISEQKGLPDLIANSYIGIGVIYKAKDKNDDALKYYLLGLDASKKIGDKQGISICYNNIAELYQDIGKSFSDIGNNEKALANYSEALKNNFLSLQISGEIGDQEGVITSYINLGILYYFMKELKKAKNYLNKALVLSQETGDKEGMKDTYDYLFKIDSTQRNYESALTNYIKFIDIRDSLVNKQNTEKIVKLQMQYEFDKKEDSFKYQKQLAVTKLKEQVLLTQQEKKAKNYFITGLVLVAILSFFIFRNFQNKQKLSKLYKVSAEKQMTELQLQSLRAQLNPHFMFNSLNAIQELIVMEENEKSQSYLERFAQLLRQLLDNATQPFIPLRKEINFLEHYLSLESLRLPELKYYITIDPEVKAENITIPNMMLQPYIENALWHGLQHKQGEKKLELHISRQNGSMQYKIKDNGVGRKKAEEMKSLYRKEHRSKGMELLSQRFDLLSQEYGQHIQTRITDLTENGDAAGTLVEINVPALLSDQDKKIMA